MGVKHVTSLRLNSKCKAKNVTKGGEGGQTLSTIFENIWLFLSSQYVNINVGSLLQKWGAIY